MSIFGDQLRIPMARLKAGGTPSANTVPRGDGQWITLASVNSTVPSGNTVASTADETAFATSKTVTGSLLTVGTIIRVKVYGVYGTTLISPTLTGKIKIGGVTVLNTGALTAVANVTNAGWTAEFLVVVTATGASGTVEAQGYAQFATAATTGLSVNVANTAAVTGIDWTANPAVTLTVQWSVSSSGNTITARAVLFEIVPASSLG